MKKTIILMSLLIICNIIFAQTESGMWTWMHGDTIPTSSAVYGTKGIPSQLNKPNSMMYGVNWTDKNGKFWLYGGTNLLNDMWMFDPTTLEWTWMSGSHTSFEVTGTQGTPSSSNTPGTVDLGAVSWVDSTGALWMFGGYKSYSPSNKLWKYNTNTNEWTWMKGNAANNALGSYGVKGIPNSTNEPRSRFGSMGWVDKNNNLWLYGGVFDTQYNVYLNDVWMYSITTNEWTWISGQDPSLGLTDPGIVVGTVGVGSPANTPGDRTYSSTWSDSLGNGYLFGGATNISQWAPDYFNDLWKFDVSIQQWICIRANNTFHTYLDNPTCVPEEDFCIYYSRFNASAHWSDKCGNFWMYGGDFNNFLWNYNLSSNKWTLTNNLLHAYPTYGSYRISSNDNNIGYRLGSCSWTDSSGHLWLFGGGYRHLFPQNIEGYLSYNDMWEYIPDTNCTPCNTSNYNIHSGFRYTEPNSCGSATITFDNESMNATTFLWDFGDQTTSTDTNPSHTFTSAGTYQIKLIAHNDLKSDTSSHSIIIYAQPTAGYTTNGDTGCTSKTIQYTNLSSQENCIYEWLWTFQGSYYEYSTNTNPIKTFYEGQYYTKLTVTDTTSNCRDTASSTIHIYPSPNAYAGGDISRCAGDSIILLAYNASTYYWSNGAINGNTYICPTQTDTVVLIVANTYNCTDSDTMIINIIPKPVINGILNGLTEVFQNQSDVIYSIPAISNATSYIWTLPQGATGTSTTNNISINFGSSAVSGYITVRGVNVCGEGLPASLLVTVDSLPDNAGSISGQSTVHQTESGVVYTVPEIANATSYIWTLPNGASNSKSTNSITVNFGDNAESGEITVKGHNAHGDGVVSTLPVIVIPTPTAPVITLNGLILNSNVSDGNQWYNQNGLINGATEQSYLATTNGVYYAKAFVDGWSSAPSNNIEISTVNIENQEENLRVRIYPNPINDELIIESTNEAEAITFEIINSIGQTVYNGEVKNKTRVKTDSFSSGLYVVKIKNGNAIFLTKIVKE